MISILTVSTLFPNPAQPAHGAFVENRLRKLRLSGKVTGEVVAPIPWVPAWAPYPGSANLHSVPAKRMVGDLTVHHPRYLVVPKIGMNLAPYMLYRSLRKKLQELLAAGRKFDLIDAHYFYPDGVAAVWLAKQFDLPVSVTARGTDLNLIPQFRRPRRLIAEAARNADGLITVCGALKDTLEEIAPDARDIRVLRNGVDLVRFAPTDHQQAKAQLGFKRKTIGSVGLLIERKGHHFVIEALQQLPDLDLVIVGDGPERSALQNLAKKIGVEDRVRFLGLVEQARLPLIYSALDGLVLASSREGWANVLLEAMACGTPVVATAVWGTPEVVASPEAGVLVHQRDGKGIAEGLKSLFKNYPDRAATRAYAENFSWDATTEGQLDLFAQMLNRSQSKRQL